MCFCIDLVVIGTGSRIQRLDSAVAQYLKRKGISLEVQDTVRGFPIAYVMVT